jgi:hypothetical protein
LYNVFGVNPDNVDVKFPVPVPSEVTGVVGFALVPYATPFAVIVPQVVETELPPVDAPVEVIELAAVVVTETEPEIPLPEAATLTLVAPPPPITMFPSYD